MSAEIVSLQVKAEDRLALAEKIHRGLRSAQIRGFLEITGMTQEQLFVSAHIPVSTGRRRLAGKGFSEHESERIARIARIYDAALELFPGPRALEWLMAANPRLGGRTPLISAGTEIGAAEVESLLGRLAHGVF